MHAPEMSRLGVYVFPWGQRKPEADYIIQTARHAEALGFDSVHMPWHLTIPTSWLFEQFGNRYLLDPLVLLPAIAMATERIRIGLNAAILPLFHPLVWARYLASLDALSSGRCIAGVAVGWWEEDFIIGGAPLNRRGVRMDEALEALAMLLRGEEIAEPGASWDARGLHVDPQPVQPVLPIWVGGGDPSVERAARGASALMPSPTSPEDIRRLRSHLDEAGSRHGRHIQLALTTYVAISTKTKLTAAEMSRRMSVVLRPAKDGNSSKVTEGVQDPRVVFGPPEQCAEQLSGLFEAVLDYLVADFHLHGLQDDAYAREQMSRFVEEVIPAI
jgi:alkanesulfonate monooxygenase SsuD/methylene tetrahydromethanopterin reductase-like flavin-dependent oxidoreductase (luciferase family)